MKQLLHPCKIKLDWAPAETPAKIAGLGNSQKTPRKLLDWAQAETIQFELLENSRPPACFWKLGAFIIQVSGTPGY